MQAIEAQLSTLGSDNIVCVLSTTSCFAPRVSDSLEKVACLCQKFNVPHLVNNAYGLQSTRLMHSIQDASRYAQYILDQCLNNNCKYKKIKNYFVLFF